MLTIKTSYIYNWKLSLRKNLISKNEKEKENFRFQINQKSRFGDKKYNFFHKIIMFNLIMKGRLRNDSRNQKVEILVKFLNLKTINEGNIFLSNIWIGAIWHGLTKTANWMERSSEKRKFKNLLKNHISKAAFSLNLGMMVEVIDKLFKLFWKTWFWNCLKWHLVFTNRQRKMCSDFF